MDIYDPIAWIMLHATVATIYAAAVTLILLKESAADAATIDYLISQLAEQSKTPDQGYEWTLHPSKARDVLADELERTYGLDEHFVDSMVTLIDSTEAPR